MIASTTGQRVNTDVMQMHRSARKVEMTKSIRFDSVRILPTLLPVNRQRKRGDLVVRYFVSQDGLFSVTYVDNSQQHCPGGRASILR
jgi:hypothetical protein